MADDNFRSYRSRESVARDAINPAAPEAAGDPLAELARLIGQGDPYAEGGRQREAYSAQRSGGDTAQSGNLDWAADESYADDRAKDHYVRPSPPPPTSHAPEAHGYERSSGSRYFSGPAAKFNGFREDAAAYDGDEERPDSSGQQLPSFMSSAGYSQGYEANEPEHDGEGAYAAANDQEDAARPRRRSGLVVVMAVFGLAVIGTAGAFGYRYMFGGSVLPTLPPIIKASNGPNKLMPSYGDSQASNSSQANGASASATENLVSREEQPVNMEPPKAAPRVVSTIPVTPAPNPVLSGSSEPTSWPTAPAPVAGLPPAPSPTSAAPVPAPTAAPSPPPAPAPVSSEPKKIHTVTIRADQPNSSDAVPVPPIPPPAPAPAARNTARPTPAATKPTATASAVPAANAPLSIVPGAESDGALPPPPPASAASRSRTAAPAPAASMTVASAAPAAGLAAPSSGGGYAVQVTSQRSEAEAQVAFRALRAKFPNQLSGREPIIRRADLGAKGTYYRALVGPFASMEEAAGLCSGLKAAGGNCLVQRN